jgi:hypothetical protein
MKKRWVLWLILGVVGCCLLATALGLIFRNSESRLSYADFEKINRGGMTPAQVQEILGSPLRADTWGGSPVKRIGVPRKIDLVYVYHVRAETSPNQWEKLELGICFYKDRVRYVYYVGYEDSTMLEQALEWLRAKIGL